MNCVTAKSTWKSKRNRASEAAPTWQQWTRPPAGVDDDTHTSDLDSQNPVLSEGFFLAGFGSKRYCSEGVRTEILRAFPSEKGFTSNRNSPHDSPHASTDSLCDSPLGVA